MSVKMKDNQNNVHELPPALPLKKHNRDAIGWTAQHDEAVEMDHLGRCDCLEKILLPALEFCNLQALRWFFVIHEGPYWRMFIRSMAYDIRLRHETRMALKTVLDENEDAWGALVVDLANSDTESESGK